MDELSRAGALGIVQWEGLGAAAARALVGTFADAHAASAGHTRQLSREALCSGSCR